MEVLRPDKNAIGRAAKALSDGLLVAFPTETVYGLGANALDTVALQRLYAAKGRPADHPVIVHITGVAELANWASSVPPYAQLLAESLWPGPLTLILPKAAHVQTLVSGGQNSVGLRVPSHPVALELLREFGGGVAAPSANKFGKISPTSAEDVAQGFAPHELAIVLDGGACEVGIESTIVDCTGEYPRILRPGMILPEQIEKIIEQAGCRLWQPGDHIGGARADRVRAPGGLPSHYAPSTPLSMVRASLLSDRIDELLAQGKRVCVFSLQVKRREASGIKCWIAGSREPELFARQLYRSLRKLDREESDVILVECVPETAAWSGIADRLQRASAAVDGQIGIG